MHPEQAILQNIANEIRRHNYSVTLQASIGLFSKHEVDMLVQRGNDKIAVEFKRTPITITTIMNLLKLRPKLKEAIIVAPKEAIEATPTSVTEYANQTGIRILSLEDIPNIGRLID